MSYGGSASFVGLIMQPAFAVASIDTRLSLSWSLPFLQECPWHGRSRRPREWRCSGYRDSADCSSDRQRHRSAAPNRLAVSSFPGEWRSWWSDASVRFSLVFWDGMEHQDLVAKLKFSYKLFFWLMELGRSCDPTRTRNSDLLITNMVSVKLVRTLPNFENALRAKINLWILTLWKKSHT